MTDNPFEKDKNKEEVKPAKEVANKGNDTPLQIVQRILAQYDNKESDIPPNLNEYWSAKRRL